ncbi:hypothetical protein J6590_040809 [Homalodisca vitripennis]|nr:hypothetical protein J6590_040809 [Homalodisca vitripennis]
MTEEYDNRYTLKRAGISIHSFSTFSIQPYFKVFMALLTLGADGKKSDEKELQIQKVFFGIVKNREAGEGERTTESPSGRRHLSDTILPSRLSRREMTCQQLAGAGHPSRVCPPPTAAPVTDPQTKRPIERGAAKPRRGQWQPAAILTLAKTTNRRPGAGGVTPTKVYGWWRRDVVRSAVISLTASSTHLRSQLGRWSGTLTLVVDQNCCHRRKTCRHRLPLTFCFDEGNALLTPVGNDPGVLCSSEIKSHGVTDTGSEEYNLLYG